MLPFSPWGAQAASLHSSAACRRKFVFGRLPNTAVKLPALPKQKKTAPEIRGRLSSNAY